MQNVEFKCELRDPEMARAQCMAIEANHVRDIVQTDIYYRLADGRLKKRDVEGDPIEWIYYHRPDRITPRLSHFMIYSEDQAKSRFGILPLREWVTVKKKRSIYLRDNVRIHLDEVENLGRFLEFEAQVSPKFNVKRCHEQIAELRQEFEPFLGEAVGLGYADLMALHLSHQEVD